MAADTSRHAVNFVTATKGCHAVAYGLDRTGHVEAKDRGQRMAGVGDFPFVDFDIKRIDAGTVNPDQHLTRADSRA